MLRLVLRVLSGLLAAGLTVIAEVKPGSYNLTGVRDPATLETHVIGIA